jgi:glutaredoxin
VKALCLGGYPAAVDYPDKSDVCPHCHRAAAFDLVHRVRISPEFAMIVAAWNTAGARRAAAAMFRGSVEAICDALGVPRTAQSKAGKEYPRKLRDRVDDLATKGVDRDIVDDLHEAPGWQ